MSSRERRFAVHLHGQRVGVLHAKDDVTWFVLDAAYLEDPKRAVLGLPFEERPRASYRANMRLYPWFSNLLPEGALREWIAEQRGVSPEREVELLAEVGHDLPGAVTVVPTEAEARSTSDEIHASPPSAGRYRWRFSLAGVQMKFSLLKRGERFTVPGVGEGGDWIVKLPDQRFPLVPRNEHAMLELARRAGIDVPDTRLVERDLLPELPAQLWPSGEHQAFAIRRFDRGPDRVPVHMEDLAQVRGVYPRDKYQGSFETVANLAYRRRDVPSLREVSRRLAFNVLIRNADAHLKNWTLLYRDPRVPTISPAYDLVCTGVYEGVDRDLGLRFLGSKRFETITLASFRALQARLGAELDGPSLADEAAHVVERALSAWPEVSELLEGSPLAPSIGELIKTSAASMLRGT